MDTFLNLAKQGYEAYSESHSNVSKTGGQEYNAPHHSQQDGSGGHRPQFNNDEIAQRASQEGSGDPSMFSSALGHVARHTQEHEEPIDEEHVQNAHQQAYQNGNARSLSASSMGGAAALQVLQKFTSGGGSGSTSDLMSMAMSEASKLFDSAGGSASGGKQEVINSAAMTVMKLVVQSKFSSMTGGGNSGGLGGLMGLASKFL